VRAKRKHVIKAGDLVRVKESTHDEQLPATRLGIVLSVLPSLKDSGICKIRFTNEVVMNFHTDLLEIANAS